MSADDRTDRFRPVFEPEDIFERFVRNANSSIEDFVARDDEPTGRIDHGGQPAGFSPRSADSARRPEWDHEVTRMAPSPYEAAEGYLVGEGARPAATPASNFMGLRHTAPSIEVDLDADFDEDGGDDEIRTVPHASPLTDARVPVRLARRGRTPDQSRAVADPNPTPLAVHSGGEPEDAGPEWESGVGTRGSHTLRLEAMRVVPDVEQMVRRRDAGTFIGEGVEDGQVPTRQLDQLLSDMAVLLRYGHAGQVRERLERIRRTYPEDLLLLRRIAEFHVEYEQTEAALEALFALASGLFERRNVDGMRQALEQVLVLDPDNVRAYRLLALLERRPRNATT